MTVRYSVRDDSLWPHGRWAKVLRAAREPVTRAEIDHATRNPNKSGKMNKRHASCAAYEVRRRGWLVNCDGLYVTTPAGAAELARVEGRT